MIKESGKTPACWLTHDLLNGLTKVNFQPFVAGHNQFSGIETELMKDGGMQIGHVVPIFDRMES